MIYLDNAATTFHKPQEVAEAVYQAMSSMGNAGRGAHNASLDASRTLYEARVRLAKMFGAKKGKQIVFTSNSTEGLNTVINGLFEKEDHVITTQLEHNSVLRPLYRLEDNGMQLSIIKSDRRGRINYQQIEEEIKNNTKAVVCTHASNLTGNLLDIEKIGTICKKHNLLLIVDASQTAGVFPIDVEKMNIDVLCFTGHKGLLGPQGTGGMYVREGLQIAPLKVGGSGIATYEKKHPLSMPEALEAGTVNGHGIAGLLAAVKYIDSIGSEAIREKEEKLMVMFYHGVKGIPGVKVYGDFESVYRAPIVTLNIWDFDSAQVSDELFVKYEISTRPGAHCAPLMHEALGTVQQGAVRFSFSHFNTEAEVQAAIDAVKEIANEK